MSTRAATTYGHWILKSVYLKTWHATDFYVQSLRFISRRNCGWAVHCKGEGMWKQTLETSNPGCESMDIAEAIDDRSKRSDEEHTYLILLKLKQEKNQQLVLTALKVLLWPQFKPRQNALLNAAMVVGLSPSDLAFALFSSCPSFPEISSDKLPFLVSQRFFHLIPESVWARASMDDCLVSALLQSRLVDSCPWSFQARLYRSHLPAFDHLCLRSFNLYLRDEPVMFILAFLTRQHVHCRQRLESLHGTFSAISYCASLHFIESLI